MKNEELRIAIPDTCSFYILHSSFEILHSRLLAEEVGFEPTVPVTRYGGFQDRCLKPLDHSSLEGRRQQAEGDISDFCLLPSAFCLLPSAFCFCLLPSAFCLLPSIDRHVERDVEPQLAVATYLVLAERQRHGDLFDERVGSDGNAAEVGQ